MLHNVVQFKLGVKWEQQAAPSVTTCKTRHKVRIFQRLFWTFSEKNLTEQQVKLERKVTPLKVRLGLVIFLSTYRTTRSAQK